MAPPLPPLVIFSDYDNNWDTYLEALYHIYLDEVVNAGIMFRGLPLRVQFRPLSNGKGFGFWHLISNDDGGGEEERTPDFRRCERILWVSWMIINAENLPDILWWENKRGYNTHIVLWFRREGYVVILAKRQGYYLLKSAYTLKPHRAKVFEKEWKQFWKKG
jgi:hypothetical protein